MRANYGYADGSGEYYLTIDTDKCNGCGDCVEACPKGVFVLSLDDYDELKAIVKMEFAHSLSYECPGFHKSCVKESTNCHTACDSDAIAHSW
jgi:ferredoxin